MSTLGTSTHVEHVMGMAVSMDVRDDSDSAGPAIKEVVAWLHHVDATFSTYKPESEISRFGRGELRVEELSAEVESVLDMCDVVSFETDGAFDVHTLAPNGTHLEPSGLVKGWSIQQAALLMEANGIRNFAINAGGDIVLRGEPSPGSKWRVGIRHPEIADQLAAVVHASGPLAIATSATYERGDHIIDPRTGGAAQDMTSVTIVGPDLTFVDAYATAVFVMGLETGLTWLAEFHPDHGAFVITPDQQVHSTPVFDQYRSIPTGAVR